MTSIAEAAPPRLSIFHFDVNTGDATLIISPDGHGVLIDAGDQGRGLNPIREFLDHARRENVLTSLDYVISTHYDADHIGGMDEVLTHGWYPAIAALDRGNAFLPPFDRQYVQNSCRGIDPDQAEQLVLSLFRQLNGEDNMADRGCVRGPFAHMYEMESCCSSNRFGTQ